ncbi:MAG: type 1 glutamine amidotransferase [Dorea sp.]|uniref:gamma-glutamyl-gamma-aminobutyrate hydrolase family protein n=1 Tax=Sporofaciens musculi TaxID=2681861 RepID=UPI00216F0396|nr:type 1 glutamine amidotransferase [Sporofaciens musculi]MCI9423303.1 type 1 glutamine amidotransferase [Dorea sp.]
MKPIIGIVSCGYMKQRQFVPQTYIHAIEKSGAIPILLPCTQDEDAYFSYGRQCDGFLFCGGDDVTPLLFGEELMTERGATDYRTDNFHITLMKYLLSLKLPILAICRGMQLLNICHGGTIYQDISLRWPASLNHMQLSEDRSDPCHKITVIKDSKLSNIFNENEVVNSFHHQCIRILGANLNISAVASDGIIEAIESDQLPFVVGVQWHPECMLNVSSSMQKLFYTFIEKSKNAKNLQYISPKPRTQ